MASADVWRVCVCAVRYNLSDLERSALIELLSLLKGLQTTLQALSLPLTLVLSKWLCGACLDKEVLKFILGKILDMIGILMLENSSP